MMKGKVYADCGHEMERIPKPNFVWDYDGEGKVFVSMETTCDLCFVKDDADGYILGREAVRDFLEDQVAITPNMRYSGDIF